MAKRVAGTFSFGIALSVALYIPQIASAATNIGPVDLFYAMGSSTPGSIVSPSALNAGTIASSSIISWNLNPSNATAMSFATGQTPLLQPVIVGGTTYVTSTPDTRIAYNNNISNVTITSPFPAGHRVASAAGWITFGPSYKGVASQLYDYLGIFGGSTGQFAMAQLNNGHGSANGPYDVSIETDPGSNVQHSAGIPITPGGTYWVSLNADYNRGIASLALFNTSGAQLGYVTSTMTSGEDAGEVMIGNNESGTASSTSYFENIVVDYTNGAFPLGPGIVPASISSFKTTPSLIPLNASTTLSWNTLNASSVTISGSNLSVTTSTVAGGISVTPSATGTDTYTLTATNNDGINTATTSITVMPAGGFIVQSAANQTYSGSSVTATFSSNVSANDMIVLGTRSSAGAAITSITSACVPGGFTTSISGGFGMAYGVITSSGSCGVTATFATSGIQGVVMHEVRGVATINPLDASHVTAYTYGATSQPSSGTSTTNFANDYIFGFEANGSNVAPLSAGSGFTLEVNYDSTLATEDMVQSAPGPISAPFVMSSKSGVFTVGMMALKPMSFVISPSIPSGLTATASGTSEIDLAWSPSTAGTYPIAGYTIYRCIGGNCNPSAPIATTTQTVFIDTTAIASTTYSYAVTAFDLNGNTSNPSSLASATTQPLPQPPTVTAFTDSPATIALGASTTLSWNVDNASSVVLTSNTLDVSTSTLVGSITATPDATGTVIYTLSADNPIGATTSTTSLYVDGTPPSIPLNVVASSPSSSEMNLSWSSSTDDSAVAGYNVYRCLGDVCDPSTFLIATTSQASYLDTNLSPATTYTYAISAYDAAGNVSAFSDPASGTTQIIVIPPSIPSGLTITASGTSEIDLAWSPAATGTYPIAGYNIYRCLGGTCTPISIIATTTQTVFADMTTAASTTYTYAVTAFDINNNSSGLSSTAVATTQPLPQPPTVNAFSASPSAITISATSTLSWNITNASSVTITPGSFTTSTLIGSLVVAPTSTTVYTLSATNPNGIVTATTTVTANPLIRLVQSATAEVYSGKTVAATFPSQVGKNDLIAVGAFSSAGVLQNVTSSCISGNLPAIGWGGGSFQGFVMAYSTTNTTTTCMVRANFSASGINGIVIQEVSGIATSSPLDAVSTSTYAYGTASNLSSGTSTTSMSGDYILGFVSTGNGVKISSLGTGFTAGPFVNDGARDSSEYMVQPTVGPVSASFQMSSSGGSFDVGMMAFKPKSY